jgi:hypothetical protein
MNRQILLKISAILSFIFITLALILIKQNSPAKGYELSLYASLPSATWIFLIGSIIIGMGIIVDEAFYEREGNFWYFGYLALILSNLIILSLHLFRGYYFVTISDPFNHMSYVSSIVSNGSIGINYYPITHILGAFLVEVCSIDSRTTVKILPILFSMISMVFIYLLASVVAIKRSHSMLAAAAGSTLTYSYYHISIYPQALSLFIFPLLFYLYFKAVRKNSVPYKILFVILLILFPFIHPYTEIVLIFCLAGGEIARILWKMKMEQVILGKVFNEISSNPSVISIAIFFTWFSSFSVFSTLGGRFLRWFSSNAGEAPRFKEVEYISSKETTDLMILVLKMYGDQFIYLLLSTIALIIIFKHCLNRNDKYEKLFILSSFIIISGPVYALIFLSLNLTTIGRFVGSNTILWVIPILTGFSLYELFKKIVISRRTIAFVVVTLILVLASVLGIFTLYRSPWINQPNMQVTDMDMKGITWSESHKIQGTKFAYLGWLAGYDPVIFPPHFGDSNITLGSNFNRNLTIILTQKFRLAAVDPILSRNSLTIPGLSAQGFDSSDIKRLEKDISVEKLYMNGEFEILYVKTKGEVNESSLDC